MIISGAGSSVTVNGFTGIGIFGPASLSISSGGGTGGPGVLTVSNGAVVNSTTSTTIGDAAEGSSNVVVTGAGSVLNASNSLAIGGPGCGCGPLVGTLTVADGGVVIVSQHAHDLFNT
jgi:T5SS/PEP-CTERM-associated repeat protein